MRADILRGVRLAAILLAVILLAVVVRRVLVGKASGKETPGAAASEPAVTGDEARPAPSPDSDQGSPLPKKPAARPPASTGPSIPPPPPPPVRQRSKAAQPFLPASPGFASRRETFKQESSRIIVVEVPEADETKGIETAATGPSPSGYPLEKSSGSPEAVAADRPAGDPPTSLQSASEAAPKRWIKAVGHALTGNRKYVPPQTGH